MTVKKLYIWDDVERPDGRAALVVLGSGPEIDWYWREYGKPDREIFVHSHEESFVRAYRAPEVF